MMQDFLQQIMAFPTVIYTSLLAVVLLYWLFVIFGALDIDMFDGAAEGAAEGALDAASEGAAEGLAEGLAEGASEGLAEGLAEGAAEGLAEGAGDAAGEGLGGAAEGLSLASLLGLRRAPFTVIASLLILLGWAACFLGMQYLTPVLDQVLPHFVSSGLVALASLAFAMPVTGLTTKPMAPLFETHRAGVRRDLVGKTCRIETGTVDGGFGLATVEEDGGWMKVQVRCAHGDRFARGDEALIIAYSHEEEAFRVEPMRNLEPELAANTDGPERARRAARARDQGEST